MSAKQPTDYIRAYHLARKLAYKRIKRINELRTALKELVDVVEAHLESGGEIDSFTTQPAKIALKNSEKRI